MARADIKMPEDFLMKLSKLGEKTDEIIPKVLQAGGEIVLDKVRGNLSSVIGTNPSIYSSRTSRSSGQFRAGAGIDQADGTSRSSTGSRSTGELENALGLSPAKQDGDGNWDVKVGFREPRSDGSSNAKIASVLEYGKHNQPARPFLTPAKNQSRASCVDAMKSKFDSEVDSI